MHRGHCLLALYREYSSRASVHPSNCTFLGHKSTDLLKHELHANRLARCRSEERDALIVRMLYNFLTRHRRVN